MVSPPNSPLSRGRKELTLSLLPIEKMEDDGSLEHHSDLCGRLSCRHFRLLAGVRPQAQIHHSRFWLHLLEQFCFEALDVHPERCSHGTLLIVLVGTDLVGGVFCDWFPFLKARANHQMMHHASLILAPSRSVTIPITHPAA